MFIVIFRARLAGLLNWRLAAAAVARRLYGDDHACAAQDLRDETVVEWHHSDLAETAADGAPRQRRAGAEATGVSS